MRAFPILLMMIAFSFTTYGQVVYELTWFDEVQYRAAFIKQPSSNSSKMRVLWNAGSGTSLVEQNIRINSTGRKLQIDGSNPIYIKNPGKSKGYNADHFTLYKDENGIYRGKNVDDAGRGGQVKLRRIREEDEREFLEYFDW